MRRLLSVLLGVALLVPLQGLGAQAENRRERYSTAWINVFWHSRQKVDGDTYRLITWYAGAYDSGEEYGFWSDLYRSVSECEKRDGRDKCRYLRKLSYYGDTREGTFTIDRKLSTSHLAATYKLHRWVHGEREFVGKYSVSTDALGTGKLAHGRSSYTYHEGCVFYSYSGNWVARQGTATGTLTRAGEDPRDLGETDDTWMGRSDNVDFGHDC